VFLKDLTNRWQGVRQLVPARDSRLQAELNRQQHNEQLRRQFASRANAVGQWLESQMDAVSTIGMQRGSSLEDQLNRLRAIDREVSSYHGTIDDLYRCHEAIQEAMIFDNQHTPYTAEVCIS
jgi:actinin alpha 1/4